MPKKPPRNNFYYFMRDFKDREETAGVFFNNMNEVAAAAGVEWQQMSPNERKPFDLKAKEMKGKDKVKKYTSTGEDIELLLKREKEKVDDDSRRLRTIESIVVNSNDFTQLYFYVAQVNHYCFCNKYNKHLPAEISIVRFSLQDGVDLEDIYHVILDIGNLPIGYRLAAETTSQETHLIPTPPHEDNMSSISEKDLRKAFFSMIDFLRKNVNPSDPLPPVYVDEINMGIAEDVFKNLSLDYGESKKQDIPVYSLSYLFYVLRNTAKTNSFPAPTLAQNELEKDIYDYVKGIACEYHNITDVFPHCTLSKCIRKIFIICDNTCHFKSINLIPGHHIPKNANISRLVDSRPSSVMKSAPLTSSVASLRIKGDDNDTASLSNISLESVPQEPPKMRLPKTRSIAAQFQVPPSTNSYNDDFPALGAAKSSNKPPVIGRGRGRILANFSK